MPTRFYCGYIKGGKRQVFKSDVTPRLATHGEKYFAVVGPFRTKRAAIMCAIGAHGPSIQTVREFEYAARLRAEGRY